MDYHDKILSMARSKPVNPTEVAKAMGKDSFIASAMLSEMVQKGLLKISSLKVGSSPLYYDPKQPEHLLNYSSYLNEKDKKTFELLKEQKVLRENSLDPLSRVCVKNLKDFARPLEVSFNNNKEIFWKWYLLPDAEAEQIIRQVLSSISQPPESLPAKDIQSQSQEAVSPVSLNKPESKEPENTVHAKDSNISSTVQEASPAPLQSAQSVQSVPENSTETRVQEDKKESVEVNQSPALQKNDSVYSKTKKSNKSGKKNKCSQSNKKEETQKRIVDKIKEMIVPASKPLKGSSKFLEDLTKYFNKKGVVVLKQMEQKRKTEFEFIVTIDSSLGPLIYYCHAKDKKRVGEADLSNAFVQGQLLKLPVLLLINGNLTKGAEKISKDFKGVAVRNL